VFILSRWTAVDDQPAVVLGLRQTLCQVYSDRIEKSGIDLIVIKSGCTAIHGIGGSDCDRLPARSIGNLRKISCKHRGRRHIRLIVRWIRSKRRSLISAEKEQPVLQDRSSRCSAELISLERAGFLVARRWIDDSEIWCRIEEIVAHKFEQIAMQPV